MKPPRPRRARRPLDVDTLWQFERVGAVSIAPDGRDAVCAVSRWSMARNEGTTQLWLLPTDRCAPRRLTTGGEKDGQPAFSPRGDRIAFVARRAQDGEKDEAPQLYTIARDGGEAQRASRFAPGVESFKWLPDGRRIVFSAWVWPDAKGAAAQARRVRAERERQHTGYATSASFYRHWDRHLPEGRARHLLLLDTATGRVQDLFEGRSIELPRGSDSALGYDVHPDGTRVAFVHDPADEALMGNPLALAEIDLATRRVRTLVRDAAWDLAAPRYRPDGRRIAVTAAQVGEKHTALARLAVVEPGHGWTPPDAASRAWDHDIDGALAWADDGAAILFGAEHRGRRHLWCQRLQGGVPAGVPEVLHEGGWVQGFDHAAGVAVLAVDAASHPVRLFARPIAAAAPAPARAGARLKAARTAPAAEPLRLERFNDRLLSRLELGEVRERTIVGALGDEVQLWLTFPPRFDPTRRHGVLHVVHGGPFAAAGDTFGYRWNPHAFAASGRVVVQVNFHGSSGFGFAFRDSLIGRQGELELQDIEAATDWLRRQPWVDAQRIFAGGGSYGGFLVAWMNGHVPGGPRRRYRAYVCHAGVFDRVATFSADSWPVRPKDLGAAYWDDLPRVLAQSPATFAARMDTPTLVIHGALDYRVPDGNGFAHYHTLRARDVDARLLWFRDENHWVLKPHNSRQWYREFLAWLDRHEPGRSERAARGGPRGADRATRRRPRAGAAR